MGEGWRNWAACKGREVEDFFDESAGVPSCCRVCMVADDCRRFAESTQSVGWFGSRFYSLEDHPVVSDDLVNIIKRLVLVGRVNDDSYSRLVDFVDNQASMVHVYQLVAVVIKRGCRVGLLNPTGTGYGQAVHRIAAMMVLGYSLTEIAHLRGRSISKVLSTVDELMAFYGATCMGSLVGRMLLTDFHHRLKW